MQKASWSVQILYYTLAVIWPIYMGMDAVTVGTNLINYSYYLIWC